MKILILNSSDHTGGAAKAASRLYTSLRESGTDVKMLVHEKSIDDPNIIAAVSKPVQLLQSRLDKYELKLRGAKPVRFFSIARFGNDVTRHKDFLEADVINIHWTNRGFLSVKNIAEIAQTGKKVIWTLHDSWAFTGGCHLPYSCTRYKQHCGKCPALLSASENDLSFDIFKRKQQQWKDLPLQVFTPSQWLANKAAESELFRRVPVSVFPNTMDEKIFRVHDQQAAKKALDLPLDKKLIAFGAVGATTDYNKGYDILLKALDQLIRRDEHFSKTHALMIFGSDGPLDLPVDVHFTGHIKEEEKMAKVYAAADVFVSPSRSENLPYTVMESLACGTPAVAFDVGGTGELIQHKQNGYLAKPHDAEDFAEGIVETLANIKPANAAASAQIHGRYGYEHVAGKLLKYCSG